MSGLGCGAGAAAGQYAADRFLHHGDDQQKESQIGDQPVSPPDNTPDNNLGGDDFGIGAEIRLPVDGLTRGPIDPLRATTSRPVMIAIQPSACRGDGNDGGWDDSSGGGGIIGRSFLALRR
jgi:hypothetical protein